jgi:hypothetical protein
MGKLLVNIYEIKNLISEDDLGSNYILLLLFQGKEVQMNDIAKSLTHEWKDGIYLYIVNYTV